MGGLPLIDPSRDSKDEPGVNLDGSDFPDCSEAQMEDAG
jgi:hypothetical protein